MELELRSQRIWGWQISTYLFLGGLGGGCYLMGVLFDLFSYGYSIIAKVGVFLGAPIALIGTLFLLADLGRPSKAARAIFRPATSWISRGTIILSIFIILGLVHSAFWIWPFNWLTEARTLCKALGAINATFAFLTIIYTGLLLGSIRAIPLWCSPLLPVIFLVSGLSTGLMATDFSVVILYKIGAGIASSEVVFVPSTLKFPLLLLEGLLVVFYLYGSHLLEASRASIHKIVCGNLAATFWIGFVFLGLLIPSGTSLISPLFSLGETRHFFAFALAVLTSVSGLAGGYFLRHVIVKGGIKGPFGAQGIVVPPLPET